MEKDLGVSPRSFAFVGHKTVLNGCAARLRVGQRGGEASMWGR